MKVVETKIILIVPFPTLIKINLFPLFSNILGEHLELRQQQHLQVNLCGTGVKVQNPMKDVEKTVEYFT